MAVQAEEKIKYQSTQAIRMRNIGTTSNTHGFSDFMVIIKTWLKIQKESLQGVICWAGISKKIRDKFFVRYSEHRTE
jgi:hypothetical protein